MSETEITKLIICAVGALFFASFIPVAITWIALNKPIKRKLTPPGDER